MIRLPVHSKIVPPSGARRWLFTLPAAIAVLLALILLPAIADSASPPPPVSGARFAPKVVVLVMGGLGSLEQSAIEYDSIVDPPKARADLDAIATVGRWRVLDAKTVTKSSGGPGRAPTTSTTFRASGMFGYSDGTLPIEPFINALKRFKYIEVDYILPSSFAFRGLKNFENQFVTIELDQSGSNYRYRIVVKDVGFSKLDLPLRQPAKSESEARHTSTVGRTVLALVLALLAAFAVYVVAGYMLKKGRKDES